MDKRTGKTGETSIRILYNKVVQEWELFLLVAWVVVRCIKHKVYDGRYCFGSFSFLVLIMVSGNFLCGFLVFLSKNWKEKNRFRGCFYWETGYLGLYSGVLKLEKKGDLVKPIGQTVACMQAFQRCETSGETKREDRMHLRGSSLCSLFFQTAWTNSVPELHLETTFADSTVVVYTFGFLLRTERMSALFHIFTCTFCLV